MNSHLARKPFQECITRGWGSLINFFNSQLSGLSTTSFRMSFKLLYHGVRIHNCHFLLVPFIRLNFHPHKGIFPIMRLDPFTTNATFSKATTCQGTQDGILYPLLAPSVLVQVSEKHMPRWN